MIFSTFSYPLFSLFVASFLQYERRAALSAPNNSAAVSYKNWRTKEELCERIEVRQNECQRLHNYLDRLLAAVNKQGKLTAGAVLAGSFVYLYVCD
jgi:hypothetical protein